MIVECSNCHAKYNVDEGKIPNMGIKVKCHKCQNIIFIQKETPAPEPVQPEVPAPELARPETPAPPSESPAEPTDQVPPTEPVPSPPSQPEEPSPTPEQPEEPSVPTEPEVPTPEPPEPEVAPPEPEVPVPQEQIEQAAPLDAVMPPEPEVAAPTEPLPTAPEEAEMSEEDKKLHERARRLAKALASDLVLYNQDKVEEGLRNGTLAKLLGSEIRRSWEYYCQQIPKHIVDGTDYFKDQLNKTVGKGKEIFK